MSSSAQTSLSDTIKQVEGYLIVAEYIRRSLDQLKTLAERADKDALDLMVSHLGDVTGAIFFTNTKQMLPKNIDASGLSVPDSYLSEIASIFPFLQSKTPATSNLKELESVGPLPVLAKILRDAHVPALSPSTPSTQDVVRDAEVTALPKDDVDPEVEPGSHDAPPPREDRLDFYGVDVPTKWDAEAKKIVERARTDARGSASYTNPYATSRGKNAWQKKLYDVVHQAESDLVAVTSRAVVLPPNPQSTLPVVADPVTTAEEMHRRLDHIEDGEIELRPIESVTLDPDIAAVSESVPQIEDGANSEDPASHAPIGLDIRPGLGINISGPANLQPPKRPLVVARRPSGPRVAEPAFLRRP